MSERVKELSGAEAFGAFTGDGVALVDFWAEWCGPCKAVAPIVEEVAGAFAGRVKAGKVNVDDENNRETAQKFGVMSIPTLIVFKNGKPVDKMVGMRSKAAITETLNKHV